MSVVWPDPDRAVAREAARTLAGLLGSRAVSQRRGVLGEPLCLYAVPLHAEEFWFNVRVSERACVVEARHRRHFTLPATFSVALGQPYYGNTERSAELSGPAGAEVFVRAEPEWQVRAGLLLHPHLRPLLAELDWTVVRRVALYDIQLNALLDLNDLEAAAEQIRVLRRLLLSTFRVASGAE